MEPRSDGGGVRLGVLDRAVGLPSELEERPRGSIQGRVLRSLSFGEIDTPAWLITGNDPATFRHQAARKDFAGSLTRLGVLMNAKVRRRNREGGVDGMPDGR